MIASHDSPEHKRSSLASQANPFEGLGVTELQYQQFQAIQTTHKQLTELKEDIKKLELDYSTLKRHDLLSELAKVETAEQYLGKPLQQIDQEIAKIMLLNNLRRDCKKIIHQAVNQLINDILKRPSEAYQERQLNELYLRFDGKIIFEKQDQKVKIFFNVKFQFKEVQDCFQILTNIGYWSSLIEASRIYKLCGNPYSAYIYASWQFHSKESQYQCFELTKEAFELESHVPKIIKSGKLFAPIDTLTITDEHQALFTRGKLLERFKAVATSQKRSHLTRAGHFAPHTRLHTPATLEEKKALVDTFGKLLKNKEYVSTLNDTLLGADTIKELAKAVDQKECSMETLFSIHVKHNKIEKLQKRLKAQLLPYLDFQDPEILANIDKLKNSRQKLCCAIAIVHAFLGNSKSEYLKGKTIEAMLVEDLLPKILPPKHQKIGQEMREAFEKSRIPVFKVF